MYSPRLEIERAFSILEEIMMAVNIWYSRNKNYDTAMGQKITAYNLMGLSNMVAKENPREIMKIAYC